MSSSTSCRCFFPEEIVKEILIRSPPSTLIKCTVVCKAWQSLITSKPFIAAHLRHSSATSPAPLLLRRYTEPPNIQHFTLHQSPHQKSLNLSPSQALPFPFKTQKNLFFRIVGCINGVVLLSDDLFVIKNTNILWNPLIKRFVSLPKPNFVYELVGGFSLVMGFGFDSISDDYKVVRLAYLQGDEGDYIPPRAEVYSLKNHSWKVIQAVGVDCVVCDRDYSHCFINGKNHWIAYNKFGDEVRCLIMVFDVVSECFDKMRLPENLVFMCALDLFVAEVRGLLAVLEYESENNVRGCCNVWVEKEYGVESSWSNMYRVDVEGGVELVLSLRDNGRFLVATQEGKLVSFDPKRRETDDLGMEGFLEAFYAEDYTESLVLLDKESRASAYGGAKKSTSTSSTLQDNKDVLVSDETEHNTRVFTPTSMLSLDETGEMTTISIPTARSLVTEQRKVHYGYQMSRFAIDVVWVSDIFLVWKICESIGLI